MDFGSGAMLVFLLFVAGSRTGHTDEHQKYEGEIKRQARSGHVESGILRIDDMCHSSAEGPICTRYFVSVGVLLTAG